MVANGGSMGMVVCLASSVLCGRYMVLVWVAFLILPYSSRKGEKKFQILSSAEMRREVCMPHVAAHG